MKKLGSFKSTNGFTFRLYAPNAKKAKIFLDGAKVDMIKDEAGYWEIELDVKADTEYAYIIDDVEKVDLFANKIVEHIKYKPRAKTYESRYKFKNQKQHKTVKNVLEVYLPLMSGATYQEKAQNIVRMAKGYSHIQIMPFQYTPNEMTLGYKTSTYFAPNSKFGELDDFKSMIDYLHKQHFGVILDFCMFEFEEFTDNGMKMYDGTAMFEYDDCRQHKYFTGYFFDFSKQFVKNFILSVMMFYINDLQADGIRIDGVNEMIFKDQKQQEINEYNLKFLQELFNKLPRETKIITDLITHRTLADLGLQRIDNVEGSLFMFQLQNILKNGQEWFAQNKDYETDLLKKTLTMMTQNKVFVTINHDIHLNGVQGIFENAMLKDKKTYLFYTMLLYSLPNPKQLWQDFKIDENYASFINSLKFYDFDFDVSDKGVIGFRYKSEDKQVKLYFDLFNATIEMSE